MSSSQISKWTSLRSPGHFYTNMSIGKKIESTKFYPLQEQFSMKTLFVWPFILENIPFERPFFDELYIHFVANLRNLYNLWDNFFGQKKYPFKDNYLIVKNISSKEPIIPKR